MRICFRITAAVGLLLIPLVGSAEPMTLEYLSGDKAFRIMSFDKFLDGKIP